VSKFYGWVQSHSVLFYAPGIRSPFQQQLIHHVALTPFRH